jgi:hypothetical protein
VGNAVQEVSQCQCKLQKLLCLNQWKRTVLLIVIYGKQQKDVDSVKREILKACDDSIVVKKISGEYSELIGQLNQQQVDLVIVIVSIACIDITSGA